MKPIECRQCGTEMQLVEVDQQDSANKIIGAILIIVGLFLSLIGIGIILIIVGCVVLSSKKRVIQQTCGNCGYNFTTAFQPEVKKAEPVDVTPLVRVVAGLSALALFYGFIVWATSPTKTEQWDKRIEAQRRANGYKPPPVAQIEPESEPEPVPESESEPESEVTAVEEFRMELFTNP